MEIRLAKFDEEIAACYPVMRELRPHLEEKSFVSRVCRPWGSTQRATRARGEGSIQLCRWRGRREPLQRDK